MTAFARAIPAAVALACALLAPAVHAQGEERRDLGPMMKRPPAAAAASNHRSDIDFAQRMRQHHAGAVEMAQWELQHGTDPRMKKMAQKIIADQQREIAWFDAYLAQNGQKPGAPVGAGAWPPK